MDETAAGKEICRICIQAVNLEDAEYIDLGKLRSLIKANVVPKWEATDFENHIMCHSCVNSCGTVQSLMRHIRSSNSTFRYFKKDAKKFKNQNKFDLRLASRFKDVPKELDICRCCLESTRYAAAFLYDHPNGNLLPLSHIKMMFELIGVSMTDLEDTLNPILCLDCWQRVQVSYAFRLRLNLATEKIAHYRTLLDTTHESRNDLNDILHMWHNLAVPEPPEDDSEENMPNIVDACETTRHNLAVPEPPETDNVENMPNIVDVCKTTLEVKLSPLKKSQIKAYVKKLDLTFTDNSVDDSEEMPILSPVTDSIDIKTTEKKTNNNRRKSTRNKTAILINNKKSTKKVNPAIQVKTPLLTNNVIKRCTRSSMKNHSINNSEEVWESDFNDLLMVTKEEIVKPNRQPKKRKPIAEMPKLVAPVPEVLTETKDSSVQYTFERGNFDEELNSSDTDDEFVEGTAPLNNSNDKCPVISPEPDEIVDVESYDDDPPQLELQGPCGQNLNNFKISYSYSVDEKRMENKNSIDPEKDHHQSGLLKKMGLSVRTDLLEPRKTVESLKTVEPLLINLNTMEVKNKPTSAKNVNIQSLEVITPKYQLRKSEVDYKGYFTNATEQLLAKRLKPPAAVPNPPPQQKSPEATDTLRNDERFNISDKIIMSFINRPIGQLKRHGAPEDGGSSSPKRPRTPPESSNYRVAQLPDIARTSSVASTKPLSNESSNRTMIGGNQKIGSGNNQLSSGETFNDRVSQPEIGNKVSLLKQKSETGVTNNKRGSPLVKQTSNNRRTKIGSQLTDNNWKPQLETDINAESRIPPALTPIKIPGRSDSPQITRICYTNQRKAPKVPSTSTSTKKLNLPKLPEAKMVPQKHTHPKISPQNHALSMPKLNRNKTQKSPEQAQKIINNSPSTSTGKLVQIHNSPENFKNRSLLSNPNSPTPNQQYAIVRKIGFLENGTWMVNEPIQISESRTIFNSQQSQNSTVPPKLVMMHRPASSNLKVSESQKTVVRRLTATPSPVPLAPKPQSNVARQASTSTTTCKIVPTPTVAVQPTKAVANDCILISSDDDDDELVFWGFSTGDNQNKTKDEIL